MNKPYNTLVFNVTAHGDVNPGCDYNAFAEALHAEGFEVAGGKDADGVKMYISNIADDEFYEIAEEMGIADALAYVSDDSDSVEECDEADLDECSGENCDLNEDADDAYFDEFVGEDIDDPFNVDDVASDFDDEYDEDDDLENIEMTDMEDDVFDIDGSELGWEGDITEYDDDIDAAFESRKVRKGVCRLNERITNLDGSKFKGDTIVGTNGITYHYPDITHRTYEGITNALNGDIPYIFKCTDPRGMYHTIRKSLIKNLGCIEC